MTSPADRIPSERAVEPQKQVQPNKSGPDFDSYMQGAQGPKGQPSSLPNQVSGPSPMELTQPPTLRTGEPTFNSLIAQAKTAQDTLGSIDQQLRQPQLKLKRSQAHLLKNKLGDAHDYMNTAAGKLGLPGKQIQPSSVGGILDRFIAYVNSGQDQLVAVQDKLKELSATTGQVSPADMMLVQVKMNLAQQALEYSATLLSKVTESIKTLMGIQL